ncbi:hypothetical protein [Pedobacter sp. Leaf176]|uniref:hypothetical protein n=1 Tax=Pedobacter sp. Leaf176 TaxID=1736286 RepID=UPI0006F2AEAC|nr:hypothetical protein [Pedobacter sp. Leaf176]KQR67667.1 hypothetical protein ASF92_18510 [Pedobacter sp. Leaf176]
MINKQEIIDDLKDKFNGLRNGYIILGWEDELVCQTDEETMVQVLHNIIIVLQHKGKYVTVSEIQAMPSEDRHWKAVMDRNFLTAELIRIFTAMIQMLQGTWTSSDFDMKINWK